ncbi:hypothetical protein LV716_16780 [Flagellimonas sp. HMM57]|uniref:hypothetical protein n=1 Tax=unclassified Flagellimonas TaxID=2644544 RepID=UPI0013D4299A|nr:MULTISPECIES: hypothetical protein [unclassified Flagellimonas]UII75897.1 hypothetical protein LV716_16780 [Flagellimonas sp. HMM57]
MKKAAFLATILVQFGISAQWTDNGTSLTTIDNVGIGIDNPSRKLQINASYSTAQIQLNRTGSNLGKVDFGVDGNGLHFWLGGYDAFGNEEFFLGMNGDIGIGTNNPSQKLQIDALDRTVQVQLNRVGNNPGKVDYGVDANGLRFWIGGYDGFGNEEFFLGMNGDVGIGTNSPDAKLAVNGNIHTKEVKVDLVGWPDYVFEKEYNLPTLEEVEAHITEKGHLQDIPSAKEVEENGIKLGEMDAKLLQKIEELMLYTIQQQKEIEKLKKQNMELLDDIKMLKTTN